MRKKIKLAQIYVGKNFEKKILDYDRTSKTRPAWIYIGRLPKKTEFVKISLGNGLKRYFWYVSRIAPNLFHPTNYTEEDMSKYYDKLSERYDSTRKVDSGKFMLDKIDRLKIPKNAMILDLGAGTGKISELFAKAGYTNLTLVDFSKGMIKKAKDKKALKKSKFIVADIRKVNLKRKYDLIMSFVSFPNLSYFSEEEIQSIFPRIKDYLTKNGIFMFMGHYSMPRKNLFFKTIETGKYILNKESSYYLDWYIGRKK